MGFFGWTLFNILMWVPGEHLPCSAESGLAEGVVNPSPMSLEDVISCRLLLGLLQYFLGADCVRPANTENTSEAAVDQLLNSLHVGCCGSPCICTTK